MHSHFLEKMRNISENYFLNFYFLNVDISLTMHVLSLKLHISTQNIPVEGTVSQFFDIAPSSIFMKFCIKILKK